MISGRREGNGYAVALHGLETLPATVLQAAQVGLERGLLVAVGIVQHDFLSGPRPKHLDVRTTRLRNSISSKVTSTGNRITGQIGTNVPYARFHELGFRGTVNVSAHTRVLGVHDEKGNAVDRRKVLKEANGTVIGFGETWKRAASREKQGTASFQYVKAHTRKVNYSGRPFLRPGLEKAFPLILQEIKVELDKVTA